MCICQLQTRVLITLVKCLKRSKEYGWRLVACIMHSDNFLHLGQLRDGYPYLRYLPRTRILKSKKFKIQSNQNGL